MPSGAAAMRASSRDPVEVGRPGELLGSVSLGLEQAQAEQRRHGARDKEAHDQREADGHGQRDEQVAGHAGQKQHREEDDDRRDRRDQDRHRHLLRGIQHGGGARAAVREVAVDVFQLDDRVVDQPPNPRAKATQRKDVERLSREVQQDEGGDDRQRNRDRDDGGARRLSRKIKMTRMASAPPWMASCSSALMAARM